MFPLLLYSVLQRWEVAEYFQVCCHVVHDVSMYLQLYSGELYGVGTRSGWRIFTRMPEDTRDVRMQADVCHAAVCRLAVRLLLNLETAIVGPLPTG
jgi:hypothetical protein